ncbi:MAG: endonuclease domain-containing protein [Sphingobacteriaceae bacterium]
MSTNNFYNKKLKNYAVENRNDSTLAEICLWKFVLSNKKLGYKFNRQRPVSNYIADFMCKELNLIIEVDGITHEHEQIKKKDAIKQKELEENGFVILRLTDEDVLKNIDRTKLMIEKIIKELESS